MILFKQPQFGLQNWQTLKDSHRAKIWSLELENSKSLRKILIESENITQISE